MPIIETAADAKALVDGMWRDHARIEEFRAIRDRRMDETLGAFKNVLAGQLQENFVPYQSPEPDHEIQVLKHLMASNVSEIEVIATSNDRGLGRQPQQLEDALEALDASLFPIRVSLDECDGILGDGVTVLSLERIAGSPELAKYADPDALKEGAEGITAETEFEEDAELDDAPQAQYNRAYQDALKADQAKPAADQGQLDPHEVAYGRVTDNARMADGLRWRVRVVDILTFAAFMGDDPIRPEYGCERGTMLRNPALKVLKNYGVDLVDGRWVLTRRGQDTDNSAVGSEIVPQRDRSTLGKSADTVDFWKIRTRDGTYLYLEHMDGKNGLDGQPGVILETENEFGGKSCGYYILAGNTKNRGNFDDRYDSPILAMLVETQHMNFLRSAMLAQAYAEASRDVYQTDNPPAVAPADPSQETKSVQPKDGSTPPVAMGKVERIPDTGIELVKVHEVLEQNLDRYRSRELLAGTGSSSETGIHLARLQTQLLTQLTPFQTMRAETRKMILQDFLVYVITSGERCVIPFLPDAMPDGKKVAQPREITPKLARLPVVLRYTIGADTPESKYARIQMSQQQTEFGTISMQTHMENSGVKDPAAERRLIAKDSVRQAMIGTAKQPGFIGTQVTELLTQYTKQRLEENLGPLAPPPAPPGPPGGGLPGPAIPAEGGGQTPVQTAPTTNGVPVAPGAAPVPA